METIRTEEAPDAVGAYSQGCVVQGVLHTSGQIGLDPDLGTLVDGGPEEELRQCLRNVLAVVRAGGGSTGSIVKTRAFLLDLEDYDRLNAVYEDLLDEPLPARTVVGVNDLPGGARAEIEAVAAIES